MKQLKENYSSYFNGKSTLLALCTAAEIVDLYEKWINNLKENNLEFVCIDKKIYIRKDVIKSYKEELVKYNNLRCNFLKYIKQQGKKSRLRMIVEQAQGLCWEYWEQSNNPTRDYKSWFKFLEENMPQFVKLVFDTHRDWMFPEIASHFDVIYKDGAIAIVENPEP
jgi:hypothetical protein